MLTFIQGRGKDHERRAVIVTEEYKRSRRSRSWGPREGLTVGRGEAREGRTEEEGEVGKGTVAGGKRRERLGPSHPTPAACRKKERGFPPRPSESWNDLPGKGRVNAGIPLPHGPPNAQMSFPGLDWPVYCQPRERPRIPSGSLATK